MSADKELSSLEHVLHLLNGKKATLAYSGLSTAARSQCRVWGERGTFASPQLQLKYTVDRRLVYHCLSRVFSTLFSASASQGWAAKENLPAMESLPRQN